MSSLERVRLQLVIIFEDLLSWVGKAIIAELALSIMIAKLRDASEHSALGVSSHEKLPSSKPE